MSTKHKTSAAHFGMTFLLLSLTIVPVSMKAAGFSPKLSALVDAWSQIAGVFGDGYQPVTATELMALNQPDQNDSAAPVAEPACGQTVLACAQQQMVEETPQIDPISVEPGVVQQPETCAKAVRRVSYHRRVETIAVCRVEADAKEMGFVAIDLQEMTNIDALKNVEAVKALNRELPSRRFDIARIMRSLPVSKDVRVLLKAKALTPSTAAGNLRCNTSSVQAPELEEQFKRWATRARVVNTQPPAPENSEL